MRPMTKTLWFRGFVAIPLLLILGAGCGGRQGRLATIQAQLYTLTNLHPDARRSRMFSMNYLQDGLIPVCTPVVFNEVDDDHVYFTVTETGARFEYLYRDSGEPFDVNINKYFGPSCDRAAIATMSAVDQQGIQEGAILPGMTKRGVTLAVGFPPPVRTPTLDLDTWTYWQSRVNRLEVYFTGGVVTGVRD